MELDQKSKKFIDFFDSPNCHFSYSVFLWELFVHICVPWTYCFRPITHGFSETNFFAIYYIHAPTISVLIICLFYPLTPMNNFDAVIPLFFYVVHKSMVAFKYATLSETELKKIYNAKSKDEAFKYQTLLQIMSSFKTLDTLNFYLECAAAKLGILEGQLYFLLPFPDTGSAGNITSPSDYLTWAIYLNSVGCSIKELPMTADGRRKLDIFIFCRQIILAASENRFISYDIMILLLLMSLSILP